jgi:alpha-tubulin suppressor-like RCC1 family protein
LWAWGDNTSGQLGDNTTASKSSPIQLGTSSWLNVSAGANHTLGIRSDYTLWGWGGNAAFQVGDGTNTTRLSPIQIFAPYWVSIGGGGFHGAAVKSDGTLWTWGYNNAGQLGLGDTINRSSPVQVGALTSWALVAKTMEDTTYALTTGNGNLWAWGSNSSGAIGDSTTVAKSSPVQIATFAALSITQISAGTALTNTGVYFAWGNNIYGQVGDTSTASRSAPTQLAGTWNYIPTIAYTAYNRYGIKSDNSLWGWGFNDFGQVGDNSATIRRSSPVQIGVKLSYNVNTASLTTDTTTFFLSGGSLWGWGRNAEGTFGDGSTVSRSSPIQINSGTLWSAVSVVSGAVMAIRNDGTLWAWGFNSAGYLGDGTTISRSSPVQLGTNTNWASLTKGVYGAITTDSRLFLWGDNNQGQLGDGTTVSRSSPVQIAGSWTSVYGYNALGAGNAFTVGIKVGGLLFVWGNGGDGKIGDGTTVSKSSPVQLNGGVGVGLSSFSQVVTGWRHILALTGNKIWGWGMNNVGQLGLTSTVSRSSPTQVLSLSDFSVIAAGISSSAAIKTDGTLWTWGYGDGGLLGDGTTVTKSSPVQVGTSTNWNYIIGPVNGFGFSSNAAFIASDTNNVIYGWGGNQTYGTIGDGTTLSRSSPVQVATPFSNITFTGVTNLGEYSAGAIGNGYIFTWGQGATGVLGLGDIVNKSSPVQLGTIADNRWVDLQGTLNASGGGTALARRSDNTIWGWGTNTSNSLITSSGANTSSPVQIGSSVVALPFTGNLKEAYINRGSMMIRDGQNKLYVWGNNTFGALGLGDTVARSSPIFLSNGYSNEFIKISASLSYSSAIDTSSRLFTWGLNSVYQLGQGDTVTRSVPIQLGAKSWTSVSAGASHVLAIDNTSKLYAWGKNDTGQVGYNTPKTISMLLVGGGNTNGYILSDTVGAGQLFMWGDNNPSGSLGDNTTIRRSSPVQVAGSWTMIVASGEGVFPVDYFTFGIKSDGTLWGWGANSNAQLGDNTVTYRSSPVQVSGGGSWSIVAVTAETTLGIKTDNTIYVWGQWFGGIYGDNGATTVTRSSPVQVLAGTTFVEVVGGKGANSAAGGRTFLARKADNTLWAWGNNTFGQIGDGTTAARSSPVQISGNWTSITAGNGISGGIKSDNTLWIWGYNNFGQIGDSTTINKSSPVQAGVGKTWYKLGLGLSLTIALDSSYFLWSWGRNDGGQLGQNTTISRSSPVQVGASTWSAVACNNFVSSAIDTAGRFFAWGSNANGSVGDNTNVNRSSPVQVGSLSYSTINNPLQIGSSSWSVVSAGVDFSTGITTTSKLFTWGSNTVGQLGYVSTIRKLVAGGYYNGFAIREDYATFAWGNNANGQLGLGTVANSVVTAVQAGSLFFKDVSGGGLSSLLINQNDKLYSMGDNRYGQLGDNTGGSAIARSNPIQIGNSSWLSVSSGYGGFTSLAIKSDNTLWAWGNNIYGQFGTDIYATQLLSSPVQIGTSSWTAISVGSNFTLALKADGTLWSWGANDFGQLGRSLSTTYSWTTISAGANSADNTGFMIAIRSDGKLFSWGNNNIGQLGFGDALPSTNISYPLQIGNSSWTSVATGWSHVAAIDASGRLFTWGKNNSGQLGQNNTVARSSPVQVAGSYTYVSAGFEVTYAIKTDGTLWAWGANTLYAVGDGTTINRSSPVQVASSITNWSQVAPGTSHTLALRTTGQLYGWGNNGLLQLTGGTALRQHWLTYGAGSGVTNDGYLWTWGRNNFGQMGNNSTADNNIPGILGTATDNLWVKSESAGYNTTTSTTHAMKSNGTLWSWGSNTNGEIGDLTTVARSSPVQVAGTTGLTFNFFTTSQVGEVTAAITNDGRLYMWGLNTSGVLGLNDTVNRSSPVQVPGSWVTISIKRDMALGIKTGGTLWSWGLNSGANGAGGLGLNDTVNRSSPVQIGASTWSAVATTQGGMAAIDSVGRLFAWGVNTNGSCGQNDTVARSSPVQIGANSWTQVYGYADQSSGTNNGGFFGVQYAVNKASLALHGWGWSTSLGLVGDNTTVSRSSPVQIATNFVYTQSGSPGTGIGTPISYTFSSQGAQTITGVDNNGIAWTWGNGSIGAMGTNTTINRSSPVQVSAAGNYYLGSTTLYPFTISNNVVYRLWAPRPIQLEVGSSFTQVTAGQYSSAAIKSDSTLWVWGYNEYQALGITYSFTQIAGSDSHTMALRGDNTLYMYGLGTAGALGDNTIVTKSSPIVLTAGGVRRWTLVAGANTNAPNSASFGIKDDATLWAWGSNTDGQLGQSDTISRSSPTQIAGSWSVLMTGRSNFHMLAIKTDGTLWAWGINSNGQLGDSSTASRSSPVQLAGTWTNIWGGAAMSMALKNDGTYWTWGSNSLGQLASNTTVNRSSPVQVTSGFANVSQMRPYANGFAYLNTLGQLFAWGANNNGELGVLNDTVHRSSPVQVRTDASWITLATTDRSTTAVRTDYLVFAWGRNNSGQVGDSSTVSRSSPVQLLSLNTANSASFIQLFSGFERNYILVSNEPTGKMWAWGLNTTGQLGDLTLTNKSITGAVWSGVLSLSMFQPIPVQIAGSWTQVGFGNDNFSVNNQFAVKTDGTLWSWGSNNVGQTGNNFALASRTQFQPRQVGSSTNNTIVSVRSSYAAFRNSSGSIFTVGSNSVGQLGDNTVINKSSPVQLSTGYIEYTPSQIPGSWTQINASNFTGFVTPTTHALGLKTDNTLWSWGSNSTGQLGDNTTISRSSPVQIAGSWSVISAGSSHSGAISTSGVLWMWGRNNEGQLGDFTTVSRSSPVQIISSWVGNLPLIIWSKLSLGYDSTFATTTISGATAQNQELVWSWGFNSAGWVSLGDNQNVNRSSPVQLGSINSVQISLLQNRSSPTQVGNSNWSTVSAGYSFAYGILSNNSLFAWGSNGGSSSILSDGSTTDRISPVQLSTYNFTLLASGGSHITAVMSNDPVLGYKMVASGLNTTGQLGQNNTNTYGVQYKLAGMSFVAAANASSPVQIGSVDYGNYYRSSPVQIGTDSWSSVSSGENHSLAKNSSGLLFAWGYNVNGQVGDSSTINRSSPVQISSSSYTLISAGYNHNIIEKSDGSVYTFGNNSNGQLGDGT